MVHGLEGASVRYGWATDWTKYPDVPFLIGISIGLRTYDAGGKLTASYAAFDPDTGGRLDQAGEGRTNPILEGIYDGLVLCLEATPQPALPLCCYIIGTLAAEERVALFTSDGRTTIVQQNVPTRGKCTFVSPNRRLANHHSQACLSTSMCGFR